MKALIFLSVIFGADSIFANGIIIFGNRTLDKADGTGTYHVPIWKSNEDRDTMVVNPSLGGAGTLPGGVVVALFTHSGVQLRTPEGALVQSKLRTDVNAQFFGTSSQTAVVPGAEPGSSRLLMVRAWQGVDNGVTFNQLNLYPWLQSAEWTFVTKPLGGIPAGGGPPLFTPTMTGWGPESGAGLDLIGVPEPRTITLSVLGVGALFLRRRK